MRLLFGQVDLEGCKSVAMLPSGAHAAQLHTTSKVYFSPAMKSYVKPLSRRVRYVRYAEMMLDTTFDLSEPSIDRSVESCRGAVIY